MCIEESSKEKLLKNGEDKAKSREFATLDCSMLRINFGLKIIERHRPLFIAPLLV